MRPPPLFTASATRAARFLCNIRRTESPLRPVLRPAFLATGALLLAAMLSGDAPAGATARDIGPGPASQGPTARTAGAGPNASASAPVPVPVLDEADFAQAVEEPEGLVQWLDDGRRVVFSVDRDAQEAAETLLETYAFPRAAVVLLDVRTGRVLVFASRDDASGGRGQGCLEAASPAASVFKIVTAAALFDTGRVTAETSICYHGGLHAVVASHLVEDPARDTQCVTLAEAMGRSINVPFARLAAQDLTPAVLERTAAAFGFGGAPPPFDLRTAAPSTISVPPDRLEFARTAAGFGPVHLSALHGALLASAIATHGQPQRPWIVDRVIDAEHRVVYEKHPSAIPPVCTPAVADAIGAMMRRTTTEGTARNAFFDGAGNPFLPGIAVAGKTGTLADHVAQREYTWFVGYAPAGDPRVAVGALVVNGPRWRVRASYVAREVLRRALAPARGTSIASAR